MPERISAQELKQRWVSDPDMRALVQIQSQLSVRERLESCARFSELREQVRPST